jgi:hypothetical protein
MFSQRFVSKHCVITTIHPKALRFCNDSSQSVAFLQRSIPERCVITTIHHEVLRVHNDSGTGRGRNDGADVRGGRANIIDGYVRRPSRSGRPGIVTLT